jgi:hypothetical protein
MYKFCDTLDIRHIESLQGTERYNIKSVIEDTKLVDATKIPNNKLHIYYILISYFKPESLSSFELKDLHMDNFCNFFRSIKIEKERVSKLFYTTYNELVLSGLNPNMDNYSDTDLENMFDTIDRIYFNDILNEYIYDKRIKLTFKLNKKLTDSDAGICTLDGSNCDIEIATDLLYKPFKKGYKSQIVGGLKCYNQLECMLHVFMHEVVHLIIFVFCMDQDTEDGHGEVFQDIIRCLFGHTDFTHDLGIDTENIGVTKNDLKGRKLISFVQDGNNIIARIEKINKTSVIAITIDKTLRFDVPFVLINKKEP